MLFTTLVVITVLCLAMPSTRMRFMQTFSS